MALKRPRTYWSNINRNRSNAEIFGLDEGYTGLQPPGAPPTMTPAVAATPGITWADLINSDAFYSGDLANILADETGDKSRVYSALRQALVRFGGADALQGITGKLGAQPDWADLLDATTVGGAQAADQSGVSLSAQLAKQHADQLLAEEDVRAAKGILSSGQSGYEIGNENQRATIARNDAVNSLLDFLSGNIGQFAGRQGQRNAQRSAAAAAAAQRVADSGAQPVAPTAYVPPRPAVTPSAATQAIWAAATKKKRRPTGIQE